MHTADARLFESCGEAAGAATVEADDVDAPGGGQSRCVDAHRFTDRYRFGHRAYDDCGAVSQRRTMIGRISADQTPTMD